MSLSEKHIRLALSCAYEELEARRRGKTPGVQPWNAELIRALELELAVSPRRQTDGQVDACLEHEHDDEWIGSRQAAAILGWHERKVQRLAADLDGQKISGRDFLFNARHVRDYAAGLKTQQRESR